MNKIKVLAPDQAQKIAAGEVIERPAHVVKELIENALDAQATQISLYIEKAGKQLIRIVDNGCGMSADDAHLCFLPHATSKLTSIQELETVSSFGFRGEALASISAISKVTLITRQVDAPSGLLIQYTEGEVQEEKEVACNVGTDLAIADLFYNIPVRRKFLKHDDTEWNQIQTLVYAVCISNLSLAFKLFHDGKLILNAPPAASIKDRLCQIWDFNFAQHMIPLPAPTQTLDWLSVTGFISNHHFWRYGKNNIFFFVNNRWIKNSELSKALLKGYYNVLPPGKYPAAFITITVDKTLVDINCHPKKEEVRFIKPASVETQITTIVKQALEQNLSQKLSQHTPLPQHQEPQATVTLPQTITPIPTQQVTRVHHQPYNPPISEPEPTSFSWLPPLPITPLKQSTCTIEQQQATPVDNQTALRGSIIGQLFNTYIMIDNDNELLMIDQHAAHERILYEKLIKNFENKEGTQLLFPEIVSLSREQLAALVVEKTFFSHQGLELEQISSTEIIIKTAPPQLYNTSLKEFFAEVVAFIEEHELLDRELFRKKLNEHVHSHMACKAAIKAGDVLTHEQMHNLVQNLQQTEKRFICIHGRPTMWSVSKEEIEKHFRRR